MMSVLEFIKSNDLLDKQVQYIFLALQKEFPAVRFDDRKEILGIGEPNKYLMCYFLYSNGKLYAKFKKDKNYIVLPQDFNKVDGCVEKTIVLFKNNKQLQKIKTKKVSKRINFNIYDKELKFSNSEEELKAIYFSKKEEFEKRAVELKELLKLCIETFIKDDYKKDVVASLALQEGECKTQKDLSEKYQVAPQKIYSVFRKQIKVICKQINLKKDDSVELYDLRNKFVDKFSNCCIDVFILYLLEHYNAYFSRLFTVIFIPKKYNQEDIFLTISNNRKIIKQSKKLKRVDYNGFKVFSTVGGEIVTDLNLLESLIKMRSQLANETGALEKWIYKDKQLVLLATQKPTNKEDYLKVLNTDKGWDLFGYKVAEEIKKHLEGSL